MEPIGKLGKDMSALQGQVDQWFTDNPNATGQQIVDVIKSAGGLDANAGLTDILASRYGVAPNEVTNYYNTYAAPAPAPAPATAPAPNYEQMVRDAYGSIGRTGIGGEASNIDQAGFDGWVQSLQRGDSTPEAFQRNFQTAVADYLTKNPEDKYSTYVTNYLTEKKPDAVSGIVDLYQDVLGRAPDAAGLGNWYQQFGSEISPEERAAFEKSAQTELGSRVQGLYKDFLGRDADAEGMDYWRSQFGSTIDDKERETFRQSAAAEINKQFGVTDPAVAPTKEGVLSGFKYANESGITEDNLKKTLGEDVFNTYKTGFADYAKTGIANILADKQLSFDEARETIKFGRDYGYDAQKMADLTGTKKEVFDAIYKNYDDTTNRVVDSVLGAEDVKTDADRISRSLALQKQYGFTDDDLAKATGLSLKQVKGYLDPVKNFESDYEKLVKDPDLSEDKTKAFLTTALQNPYIKQKLGDKLQPALDELSRPPRERMLDQIGKQQDVLGGNYYRGVFGNPENIANVLEKKGVKSLADIGQKDKFEATPAEKRYFAPDGTPIQDLGNGTFGVIDAEGGVSSSVPKNQVKTVYGRAENELRSGPEGDYYEAKFVPLSDKDVDKDGNYQKLMGKVAFNKRTGEEIADLNGQIAGQSSSGGLKKKYNTLNVGFDKNGSAVLTASSQRSGLGGLVQKLAPMISMALPFVLPGLGAGLSSMLPGAGVAASGATAAIAPTLMNQALTQGIIGGGLTTLGGGQFEKGFLGGAVSPVINAGIGSLLPTGLSENATNAIRGAGTNVLKGLVQGESFEDLLGQGVLSGLTNYGLNTALGSSGLTPQQLNFATGIALPLIQGEKVNPVKVFGTLGNYLSPQPR
jgi:hypothetical protein